MMTHRNPRTGEVVAQGVEICTACWRNFASTHAGDKHRAILEGVRTCIDPVKIGLEGHVNSHGATVYKWPSKGSK